jgi:hypothetical protein
MTKKRKFKSEASKVRQGTGRNLGLTKIHIHQIVKKLGSGKDKG